jgi:hypothetical protein
MLRRSDSGFCSLEKGYILKTLNRYQWEVDVAGTDGRTLLMLEEEAVQLLVVVMVECECSETDGQRMRASYS